MDNEALLTFALNRISVLEQLVADLLRHDDLPPVLIQRWLEHVESWPENEISLTDDTVRLIETARAMPARSRA